MKRLTVLPLVLFAVACGTDVTVPDAPDALDALKSAEFMKAGPEATVDGLAEGKAFAFGGPDTYGYSWIDSDEAGGPTFDWVEISSVGTPLGFPAYSDDGNVGPIPIGFDFPFYGNTFSQLYASTNGWLSFTNSTLTTYTNQPLPNTGSSVPENLLAPWWDDMVYDESDGNSAYYYYDGYRFIVQYDVRRIAAFTPPFYKFQVILYPNGNIVFQYHTLGVTLSSSTIGIQNATKDDGLTVNHNNDLYPHEGLAILFTTNPVFVAKTTGSGHIFTEGPDGDELRTFAFTATQYIDGWVEGNWQVVNRASGTVNHYRAMCVVVIDNMAIVGGYLSHGTGVGSLGPGTAAVFAVKDNGEGRRATAADQITLTYLYSPLFISPAELCAALQDFAVLDFVNIERGNVQVHEF